MDRPHEVTAEELRAALAAAQDATTAIRLLAGIAVKHGVTQTDLAEWLGVERKTIHNWLTRLEEGGPLAGARDEERPGRPRKLSPRQRARVERALREPPQATRAIDTGHFWTPERVQRYIRETFGVTYSIPSCRRLLRDAGMQFVTQATASSEGYDADRVREAVGGEGPGRRGVWVPAGT
ncbi:MAG: helix-turn-helix domain-containing protein [Halanaeroarchaeum sp.]